VKNETAGQAEVNRCLDNALIVRVVNTFFCALEEKRFDDLYFRQHLLTGHDVDVDADTAAVRTNLVAIHIWNDRPVEASMLDRSFTASGVITAALRRFPHGWRISKTEMRVILQIEGVKSTVFEGA